jgi:hypothetical protein
VPRKLFGRSLCLPIELFGEERVDTKSDPFFMGYNLLPLPVKERLQNDVVSIWSYILITVHQVF